MVFNLFEDAFKKSEEEFMSHVRPELKRGLILILLLRKRFKRNGSICMG